MTYSFGHFSEKRQISKASKRSFRDLHQKLEGSADFAEILASTMGVFFWYIFLPLLLFRRLRRHRKRILLCISQKNGRFRRVQNLLPQKLEGFADFAEISDFVNKLPVGLP